MGEKVGTEACAMKACECWLPEVPGAFVRRKTGAATLDYSVISGPTVE